MHCHKSTLADVDAVVFAGISANCILIGWNSTSSSQWKPALSLGHSGNVLMMRLPGRINVAVAVCRDLCRIWWPRRTRTDNEETDRGRMKWSDVVRKGGRGEVKWGRGRRRRKGTREAKERDVYCQSNMQMRRLRGSEGQIRGNKYSTRIEKLINTQHKKIPLKVNNQTN